jgi:hypothetical protein
MAAKVLNLDVLSPKSSRVLILSGVEYPLLEFSVEDYIETSLAIEQAEAAQPVAADADDATLEQKARARFELFMTEIIKRIPTMSRDSLVKLSIEQLAAVHQFVNGVDPDTIAKMFEGVPATEAEATSGK